MPSDTVSAADALTLLPLPKFNALSQDQVRGIACIWDGVPLSTATAVDLGERRVKQFGQHTSWFPRACRPCALKQAMAALVDHGQSCEQCIDDHNLCTTGLGLVRAVREARR
ncbi:hypothetical protein ACWDE9_35605 [Streptomyces olivaceoviridis]|uniref:hypothetical protein n=1 Tax=Streptomyces olivaceoviridis TaxID=1921 RepID=UPI00167B975A|nr:hypothetical protein [Streptomyces olivaceoviridis]GGY73011.1 hypothetical protein GCM10010300_15470 [Streptomyces olivaceoviridis]